jgi:hypothetical protein
MRVVYLLFFLLAASVSNAQIAGYMGKRCVIGYSNYFMFAPKGPGPMSAQPSNEFSPTFNNAHCVNIEYALNQRKMICFSGQYIRTGIAYDDGKVGDGLFAGSFIYETETPYPNNNRYTGSYSKPALLSSINVAIGLKAFGSGFIAPVGRYNKFEVILMFETVKYDYKKFEHQDPNSSYGVYVKGNLGTGEYSYNNVAVAYTVGKQRVLGNKIVLDYGLRIAYTPAANIVTLAGFDTVKDIDDYYKRESRMRMFRQQLINFHLGIGFLAF